MKETNYRAFSEKVADFIEKIISNPRNKVVKRQSDSFSVVGTDHVVLFSIRKKSKVTNPVKESSYVFRINGVLYTDCMRETDLVDIFAKTKSAYDERHVMKDVKLLRVLKFLSYYTR